MNKEYKFMFSRTFLSDWYSYGLSDSNLNELIQEISYYLKNAPDNNYGKNFPGAIIEGTGGAIKYRFSPDNNVKGKSGSYRTIYFVYDTKVKNLYFLTVYGKNKI